MWFQGLENLYLQMGEHPKNEYKFRLAQVYEFEMERKRKEIPHTGGRSFFYVLFYFFFLFFFFYLLFSIASIVFFCLVLLLLLLISFFLLFFFWIYVNVIWFSCRDCPCSYYFQLFSRNDSIGFVSRGFCGNLFYMGYIKSCVIRCKSIWYHTNIRKTREFITWDIIGKSLSFSLNTSS